MMDLKTKQRVTVFGHEGTISETVNVEIDDFGSFPMEFHADDIELMTREQFTEYVKKRAIECKNEKEMMKVLQYFQKFGLKWAGGEEATEYDVYKQHPIEKSNFVSICYNYGTIPTPGISVGPARAKWYNEGGKRKPIQAKAFFFHMGYYNVKPTRVLQK